MSIETRSSQYGAVFGDWHIGRHLGNGSGGQSAVFELYRDNNGWREYSALKVISLIEEQGTQDALPQFRKQEYSTAVRAKRDYADQEVHLMEQLRGKTNIVDYLDHQFFDWRDSSGFGVDLLIRMEKLTDLRSELKRGRTFSEAEIIQIGRDICQALVICHRKNILHRDIKPENIFFNSDGDYKLGDFGVARIMSNTSVASTGIGTIAYSAPEQFAGHYDHSVDIYSLGLVLYELSNCNRLPFATSSYARQEDIQKRLAGTPLPIPGGSGDADPYSTAPAASPLSQIILKACAFKPEERYQTAEEMLRALEQVDKYSDTYATVGVDAIARNYRAEQVNNSNGQGAITGFSGNLRTNYVADHISAESPINQLRNGAQKVGIKRILSLVLGAAALIALIFALFFPIKKHEHTWAEATCTKPRTCVDCGEIEGELLEHAWAEATCTAPKYCKTCNKTEGISLGHTWVAATCTAPCMCPMCGATAGEPLEHVWVNATFEKPQHCSVCALTQGTSLSAQWAEQPISTPTGVIDVAVGGWSSYSLDDRGFVRSIGRNQNGQLAANRWENIVAISGGDRHVVGLASDGTVKAVGRNDGGQCEVSSWRNMIAVSAGVYHTVGICSDGSVLIAGSHDDCRCNVSSWKDIVKVYISHLHIVGLRCDGTVVAAGHNMNGQCNVSGWTDVIAVSAGARHTLGLRKDGTVVATGSNANGQCDVSGWTDIVAISCGSYFSAGLRKDGTVVVTGTTDGEYNTTTWAGYIYDAEKWRDVVKISARYDQILGLTKDGQVVAAGWNRYGQCDTEALY